MFIATLFIIARKWKQTKYPPTEEWTKRNVVKEMWDAEQKESISHLHQIFQMYVEHK